jgi:hypothetical protein
VQAVGTAEQPPPPFKFELYDLVDDPAERHDLAGKNPEIVATMKQEYESWFRDVSATRGYEPPPIHIGTQQANPVRLSRQDLRDFGEGKPGHWRVKMERGQYDVKLLFAKGRVDGVSLSFGTENETIHQASGDLPDDASNEATMTFRADTTAVGRLSAWVERGDNNDGVQFAIFTRR